MFDAYLQHEYLLAQTQLVLFMLAMGATLTLGDFAPVFRQPRDLVYGVTFELVLTPLIAVAVNLVAGLEAGVAMGILLIATLPGGTLTNVFTYIARANVPLSIALTAVATLLALVTVPVTLELLAGEFVPENFVMPVGKVVREIVLCVLVPLGTGMLLARFAPRSKDFVTRACMAAGFTLVVAMVVGSLGSGRVEPGRYHWTVTLTIIAFCLLTQQLSMLPLRLLRWPAANFAAIGIEASVRNVYLALLLGTLLFPPGGDSPTAALGADVLFVVLTYGLTSICVATPLVIRIRRLLRPAFRAGQVEAVVE